MKHIILSMIALVLAIAAGGQTLKITTSSGTKSYNAADVTSSSPATFSNGTTMTVGSDSYTLSDITSMVVTSSSSTVETNTVNIIYNGTSATVTMADNVAAYVTAEVSGAHVSITQTNTAAIDGDEITYVLSGSTTNGSLTLAGSYKCTVSLAGITLTNPNGAAINITNSKRIQLSAKKGTENTLTDGSGSQKACIYSKGQLQLQGNGTLNVVGNYKHGIKSASYITIKNLTLNITSTVSDGINCEEYFQMKSGTVTISGVGDDGIQCDLGGTTSTGETTDHEDEDTGNVYLEGGTLTITTTAAASKGVKADGSMTISDGTYTITTKGSAAWDSDDSEVKACAAMSADGNMIISGGTLTLNSSGSGGKAISVDGTLTISGGVTSAINTGQIAYCSSTSNWYSFTQNGTAFAFKVPASGTWIVSGGSSLYSVSKSNGTTIFDGYGATDATVSGGSSVSLSSYSGGNSGGGPGGGGGPGWH